MMTLTQVMMTITQSLMDYKLDVFRDYKVEVLWTINSSLMDYKLEVLWTINLMSWSINSKSYGLLTHSTIQTLHFVNPKSENV